MSALIRALVGDITYIATDEGWLYLAGLKDIFSGEFVGHAMGERVSKKLVMQALFRAVSARRPEKELILHSDRGSQYCFHAYRKLAKQFGMVLSMSRKGDCWDNAPMESFWGTLKYELVHHRRYAARDEAKREITEYIGYSIIGNGSRHALATCHQLHSCGDTMRTWSQLNPLDSTFSARPHNGTDAACSGHKTVFPARKPTQETG